jgi:Spherulation-specific family 4
MVRVPQSLLALPSQGYIVARLEALETLSFIRRYRELPSIPAYTCRLSRTRLTCCSIAAYPNVSFTVVINPFNGPGLDDLPDENYQREIPKLTSHPNVRVVGYVHTIWAKRDLALVCKDIEKYAQWPECSGIPGLKVTGVFVDETPNIYDAEAEAYLAMLRTHVKKMPGCEDNVVRISGAGSATYFCSYADA